MIKENMQFYSNIRHRLGNRIDGFDLIFKYLRKVKNPIIVETGCARQNDNYYGDGQSSLLFDQYIEHYGGEFYTIDISKESVDYCKSKIICKNSHVILDDSISKLKTLNAEFLSKNKKIDFLYLDSFDAPKDQPAVVFNSALHHLYEFTTIMPSLKNGCLIGVDDNWIEQKEKKQIICGKGKFIYDYMKKTNRKLLQFGYQLFWQFDT